MQTVSLTTDYGLEDYYVAELKANILRKAGEITFVDISHRIPNSDITLAAYFVHNTYKGFPEKTIHLVAVNVLYDRSPRIIIAHIQDQYFVAPDNGVLTLIFPEIEGVEFYEIDMDDMNLAGVSEVFAHIVGYLKHGLPLPDIGPRVVDIQRKLHIHPVITKSQVRGTVIHIDHYENVVINVTEEQFRKVCNNRKFMLYYKQNDPIEYICQRYTDVGIGEVLCLFNSAGFLEISINMGKASSTLNLYKNDTIQINFFE